MGSEQYTSVDVDAKSLIDRVKSLSKEGFSKALTAWVAIVVLSAVLIKGWLPSGQFTPSNMGYTAIMAVGGCGGLLAAVYCFTSFITTRLSSYLSSSIGFAALGSGVVFQALADIWSPQPLEKGWIVTASWLVSAIAFIVATRTKGEWRPSNRIKALAFAGVALMMVIAFPVVAVPLALHPSLIDSFTHRLGGSLVADIADSVAGAAALVLVLIAIFDNYRVFLTRRDRMAALMSYFLVPCAVGVMCRSATATRFDEWWVLGQIMLSGAWVILICAGGVESAFEHREATERLSELEVLHDISWSLVGAGGFHELLDLLAFTLRERLRAKIVTAYLIDDDHEKLEVTAVSAPEDYPSTIGAGYVVNSESRYPGFHSGHTVKAFKTAAVQTVNDVFIDVEFVPWKYVAREDGCAVSVPLVHQGEAMGVVNLYFPECRQITRQRLKLIATIVAATTPALENARCRLQGQHGDQGDFELPLAA